MQWIFYTIIIKSFFIGPFFLVDVVWSRFPSCAQYITFFSCFSLLTGLAIVSILKYYNVIVLAIIYFTISILSCVTTQCIFAYMYHNHWDHGLLLSWWSIRPRRWSYFRNRILTNFMNIYESNSFHFENKLIWTFLRIFPPFNPSHIGGMILGAAHK